MEWARRVAHGSDENWLQYFKKMAVFWDVVPCSLVGTDRRIRGAYYLHYRPDDGDSKLLLIVGQYLQTTRRNIPEDSHLHIRRRENLKSHLQDFVRST
jgi:hypothetical protein